MNLKKEKIIKFKIWLKLFKYRILADIFIFIISFGIAFLFDKVIETIILFLSFFLFRPLFSKQLHLKSTIKCVELTILIFSVAIIFLCPKEVSRLFSIVFGFFICLITYYAQELIDLKNSSKIKLKRGIKEEQLKEICNNKYITEQEYTVLKLYYCECKKLWEIANIMQYSDFNISKIKKKALDKLSKEVEIKK